MDKKGNLAGMVSLEDYRRATENQTSVAANLSIGEIATRTIVSVFPDETVGAAMQKMAPRDISRLPVVSRHDPKKLVGVVRRNDIVRAYDLGSIRREEARLHAAHIGSINHSKAQFTEIRLSGRSCAADRVISDLSLPHEAVIVSVQRGHELLIPHGDTRLAVGDMVTILCEQDVVQEVRSAFMDGETPQV